MLTAEKQTVSVGEYGSAVMLELEDGRGHAFRQALGARDAGRVLALCDGRGAKTGANVCQGDLAVSVRLAEGGLRFAWHADGAACQVLLGPDDMRVFEAALKAHCATLMQPDGDWCRKALLYAERNGVYEYRVHGKYMEYWSFYGQDEGWYFVRYDLEAGKEVFRGANIPWDPDAKIPAFLLAANGGTLYNYMEG